MAKKNVGNKDKKIQEKVPRFEFVAVSKKDGAPKGKKNIMYQVVDRFQSSLSS